MLAGLWSGEPFSYEGEEYRIDDVTFQPTPVQQPRIPVWVGGQWPNRAPFRRAARWDGAIPIANDGRTPITPDILREIGDLIRAHRTSDEPFDMVVGVGNAMDDPSEIADRVAALEDAGLTWAIHSFGSWAGSDGRAPEVGYDRGRRGSPALQSPMRHIRLPAATILIFSPSSSLTSWRAASGVPLGRSSGTTSISHMCRSAAT